MTPAPDPQQRPIQTVALPNTPAVRRWHAATRALREDIASQARALSKEAEAKTKQAQESKRSIGLLDQLLAAIVVPEQTTAKPIHKRAGSRGPNGATECSGCSSTDRKHLGRGLCTLCYSRTLAAEKKAASA